LPKKLFLLILFISTTIFSYSLDSDTTIKRLSDYISNPDYRSDLFIKLAILTPQQKINFMIDGPFTDFVDIKRDQKYAYVTLFDNSYHPYAFTSHSSGEKSDKPFSFGFESAKKLFTLQSLISVEFKDRLASETNNFKLRDRINKLGFEFRVLYNK